MAMGRAMGPAQPSLGTAGPSGLREASETVPYVIRQDWAKLPRRERQRPSRRYFRAAAFPEPSLFSCVNLPTISHFRLQYACWFLKEKEKEGLLPVRGFSILKADRRCIPCHTDVGEDLVRRAAAPAGFYWIDFSHLTWSQSATFLFFFCIFLFLLLSCSF